MKRIFSHILLIGLPLMLLMTCSKQTSKPESHPKIRIESKILNSSLVSQIAYLVLDVAVADSIYYSDTTVIQNGQFVFQPVEVPEGETYFAVAGRSIENKLLYFADTTVIIVAASDAINTVHLELLPYPPMVKLTPYYRQVEAGDTFTTYLELYNIARFANGEFVLAYEPLMIQLDSVTPANSAWGLLEIGEEGQIGGHNIYVTRSQIVNDQVPVDVPSLLSLHFQALTPGPAVVYLAAPVMNNSNGQIAEYSQLVVDFQNLLITGNAVERGRIFGKVIDATNGAPLSQAGVVVIGPITNAVLTDVNGAYRFAGLPFGSYFVAAVMEGYIPDTTQVELADSAEVNFSLSTIIDPNEYRFVVTWAQLPPDLDAHLWTRGYHVGYDLQGDSLIPGSLLEEPYVYLDIDFQDGLGPETITISRLLGQCKFAVNNFNPAEGDIKISEARVRVFRGAAQIGEFTIPTTGLGQWWYVCDLEADGTLIPKDYLVENESDIIGPVKTKIAEKK